MKCLAIILFCASLGYLIYDMSEEQPEEKAEIQSEIDSNERTIRELDLIMKRNDSIILEQNKLIQEMRDRTKK